MKTFYTYLWLREDGTPYYAGKGHDNSHRRRAFESHRIGDAPSPDRILIQEFESEQDAFEAERFLIAHFGRKDLGMGCLRNMTDGGEGAEGAVFSEEHKEKIAKALTGNKNRTGPQTEETCRKISKTKLANVEARAKARTLMLGNTYAVGYRHSADVLKKISEASKGNKHAAGRVHSLEERARRGAALKLAWARRKAAVV